MSRRGRQVFRERGLRAKKSFGQCFLADPNIARRIAREAVATPGGTALEVGPGTGALTKHLLDRGARVIAIERDRDLVPVLREVFAQPCEQGQLTVVEDDAASCDWAAWLSESALPRAVVGNVPYQITGRLLQRATEVASAVDRVVFMVQREVADRIDAPVGTKDYGALSVFVRRSFRVVRRIAVAPSCFRPQPSVHSAVVVLDPVDNAPDAADELFRTLVTASFSRRRKTLRNAWRGVFGLDDTAWEAIARSAQVSLDARAETLGPLEFGNVAELVRAAVGRGGR
ncbi:MAG: 16S rRNA (adenine(1518)-N(6)/adenine(1519)-N(6))-dimethyltransferase RsmA [Myxococcota bacterium]